LATAFCVDGVALLENDRGGDEGFLNLVIHIACLDNELYSFDLNRAIAEFMDGEIADFFHDWLR
jgi:hypothetical protein